MIVFLSEIEMKITFKIEKEKLIWVAIAMIFALVMFFQVGYSVVALVGFGILYFLIQGLSIETKEKWAWLWTVFLLSFRLQDRVPSCFD